MLRFFILFIVILIALFAAELTSPVQRAIVAPWTEALVRISANFITFFDPNVAVFGNVLQSTTNGFALSVRSGCNGVEAAMILIAAMLAFPASWKHRAIGIIAGLFAVQLLNIVRVISLFYLGQWNMTVFDWAHSYLWPALIMLDVLIVWMIWIRTLPRVSSDLGRSPEGADAGLQQATAR